MSLLIDGYNLLHASGILGRGQGPGGFERSRQALLNMLAESLPADELPKTTIVFDAGPNAPWGVARQTDHAGITVHYASRHEDADSMIEELIGFHSAPRSLTVVSSDHRVQRAAKRRKAIAVDSDRWFAQLMRDRRQRGQTAIAEATKPEGPYSQAEVEFWLREFGE